MMRLNEVLRLLLLAPVLGGWPVPSRGDPTFPGVLDTTQSVAICDPVPDFDQTPIGVEIWARVRDSRYYNILIAQEDKPSQTHWEIFSLPGSGVLCAYLPGNQPDLITSQAPIADGQWHWVGMTFDGHKVQLFKDGQSVADVPVARPPSLKTIPGSLVLGSLVARDLSCDAEIGEVRISSSVRDLSRIPEDLLRPDNATIALWHFNAPKEGKFLDLSGNGHHAALSATLKTFDRVDVMHLTSEEAAELDKMAQKRPGPTHPGPPPAVNLDRARKDYAEALNEAGLSSLADAENIRHGLFADWEEQFFHLDRQLKGQEPLPAGAADQVLDREALVTPDDGDPLGVILRRTQTLLNCLQDMHSTAPIRSPKDTYKARLSPSRERLQRGGLSNVPDLSVFSQDLEKLSKEASQIPFDDFRARKSLFYLTCALQREIAFSNPLLDFDRILFVARGNYGGSRVTGPTVTADVLGQHFATQYFAFNSLPGGGVFWVQDFKTDPKVVNILKDSVVEEGRLKGKKLDPGSFMSPDLSFDGQSIVFAYTGNTEHRWVWSKETSWNLFSVGVDGSHLRQLTDSEYGDFDPCWLPEGRIAFISNRRGGYIRCFALLHVPSYVLYSMKADGSDIAPLSYYETSEWHPSVNNDGMIVYTRWDYTDRENCLGSNFWISYPDGRDPRGPHGNYPYPWHTFEDNKEKDSRTGRPYVEMNIRAIPSSHRYILTGAPHHGEAFGSLALLDLSVPDDGGMSQLKRITPYAPFPETESPSRSQYPYGTPWALSEDFYLCNLWENLYLLDRFGNQVLLCENALVFDGKTQWDFRLIDPIPLRPRPVPPVLPTSVQRGKTAQGEEPVATIGVMNVHISELPFPVGTKIRWLRVIQNILKENPWMGTPMIGYQNENTPRIPLGIVPVEEDGSVYFEAPSGKELIFQVLDENFMAVQSMRSVAFVHPGERLTCMGCHEGPQRSHALSKAPMAFRRPPSKLQPEIGPVEPVSYFRTVKPVFEKSCLPCHQRTGKGPQDMSYEAIEPLVFYFAGGMSGSTVKPIHGGSRTIPGRFGARYSRMGQALLGGGHRQAVSQEDTRRVILWLDSNSQRLGSYENESEQMAGELVWPVLDVSQRILLAP